MLQKYVLRKNRGFTLVELMITIVIIAIGVALAVPSWDSAVQKRNVTSAAEEIAAVIAHAHSEAVKSNQLITVTVKRSGSGDSWCVGAIDQTAKAASGITHCECDAALGDSDFCTIDGQPQYVSQAAYEKFTMPESAVGATSDTDFFFNFDPIRGIRTDESGNVVGDVNSLALETTNSDFKLQVDVSATGRVRICSPNSTKKVSGYNACNAAPIVVPPPPPIP